MKFTTIAALVGVASAIEVEQVDQDLIQESAEMEQLCENMDEIAEDQLIETDDSELLETEADESEDRKKVSGTSKQHYSRTTKQINAENNHILSTQSKCLNFVRKYRGHPKVCNWCKKAKAPAVIWKWDHSGKVWYRWYDNKWHYWGPSKRGFTSVGWTWYKGFWHHNGYVFKYVGKYWYRFQGEKWVRYGSTVPIKPKVPRGAKICRPFYMLKKWGFPSSLGAKTLPRCRVGSGKSSVYYMWKNRKACRFLGGRLTYQKHAVCKVGKPHQWARVVRCVEGAILTNKGLNYKTGQLKQAKLSQDRRYTAMSTVYEDINSGAKKDLRITRIRSVTRNCFALGDYAVAKYAAPSKSIVHRYCTDAKKVSTVFRKPLSFTKGWDDRGVKSVRNGSLWIPNCPRGFYALGSLGLTIKNGKTPTSANFPQFRCIAAQFAERATYGTKIWSDAGSGGKKRAMIWGVQKSPFFIAQQETKKWSMPIWKLKASIKGQGF